MNAPTRAVVGRTHAPAGLSQRPLRVLVCPHELITGGSQLNAIDLAARVRDLGHEVTVFAPPGVLFSRIEQAGLPFVAAPAPRRAVDARARRALARTVRQLRPDVVHTYEWPPTMDAVLASAVRPFVRVTTVLSMDVPDFIPEDVPLIVGTQDLLERQRGRFARIELIEPPIDLEHDRPADRDDARSTLGIDRGAFVVVVVGRLSAEHEKARGVIAAIRSVAALAASLPILLVVAGTGDDATSVGEAAATANAAAGREVIRLLGDVADPRAVYAASDVVFGMGGSALRGMAHERPVIVQGRNGFWELLAPETVERFFSDGFFGDGPSGGPGFTELVAALAADPARRRALGEYGRGIVEERYSLERAARTLERLYRSTVTTTQTGAARRRALALSGFRFMRFRVRMRLERAPWLLRLLGKTP